MPMDQHKSVRAVHQMVPKQILKLGADQSLSFEDFKPRTGPPADESSGRAVNVSESYVSSRSLGTF